MPAQLVALNEGIRILLDKPILLVGRDSECDIQLDSRKVSRRHCCIAQVADYLVVRDLGSTNGIRINGIRVMEGTLKAGDELTIGNHNYQVRWDTLVAGRDRSPEKAQAAVKKDTPRPLPARVLDDDDLESCDEPIPLREAGEEAPKKARAADPPARDPGNHLPLPELGPSEPGPGGKPKTPADPESPFPFVLPEKLDLAPLSDQFPSIAHRSPRD